MIEGKLLYSAHPRIVKVQVMIINTHVAVTYVYIYIRMDMYEYISPQNI